MDSGLQVLALIAQLHQIAVDTNQLQHQFGQQDEPCSTDDLQRAAKSIGFKAKLSQSTAPQLSNNTLPAIGCAKDGTFFLLAKVTEQKATEPKATEQQATEQTDTEEPKYLIQKPTENRPLVLNQEQLEELWTGQLILLSPRHTSGIGKHREFNLSWFIPSLVKYRKMFGEVLVASFFLQLFALVTPLFFQVVMDKVLVHKGFTTLDILAFGFVVVAIFDAILGGMRNYLFSHTTNRVDVELGAKLFHHLVSLPLAYFEARQVGQSVARVKELDTIRNFITGTALTLLIDLSFTFVFFAVLWYYSPLLTWVVLGSIPFYVALSLFITPILKHRLDKKFQYGARNQAFLTEAITGVETLKAQALEPQMQRRWEDQLSKYVTSSFRAQNLNNVANQVAGFISKITTLLIIWWGAHLVIAGDMTVGQLVAFNMIAGRVTGPILKLVQLWQDFQQAGISLKRLGDILNTPKEPGFNPNRSALPGLQGKVTFEHVRFRYRPDGPLVVDELSLNINPGSIIGLVGRSGSGKSTLAKLVQRMYVPEAGRVLIDGTDLAMIDTAWLRRQIGVVQQESFLFNRTVRENIALTAPGTPMDAVVRASTIAGAHEFILNLPEGYDTIIGEQGSNLSGGQKQRMAIARALITNPKILIFDEATSALDYESERMIQENMGAICKDRTVFIIAHRLSTVRHCDNIIVMDKGRIVEAGPHEALIEADGYYSKLHSYQNHTPSIRESKKGKNNEAGDATEEMELV